jgi:D-aminoacyl-tRNA deacylase
MSVFIISSIEDPAGTNIKQHLLNLAEWVEYDTFRDQSILISSSFDDIFLITIAERTIYQEHLDREIAEMLGVTPELIIFLSRHSSKMGKPSLTVHPIGNYGSADFGGTPHTLTPASPRLMTHLLRKIYEHHRKSSLGYQVCFEVTHHGPYLSTPTVYVEVGSTETQWRLSEPAHIIASAVYDLFTKYRTEKDFSADIPVLLGIGGGHYAPRFTDIVLERNAAFGHMIPSYHIDAGTITQEILEMAIQQTPNISAAYIHTKGLKKPQVRNFKEMLSDLHIPAVSSKDLPFL